MAQFWQKLIHKSFIFWGISFKNAPMSFDKVHTRVNLGFYNKWYFKTFCWTPDFKYATITACVECNKHDLHGKTFTVATLMEEYKRNAKNTNSNHTHDSGCSCQSSSLTRPHSDQTKGHANSSGPVYLQVMCVQQCLQDIKADSANIAVTGWRALHNLWIDHCSLSDSVHDFKR